MIDTVAVIVAELQLGEYETRAELVALLQTRRAAMADALASKLPGVLGPRVQLRSAQRREVELCEQALADLDAPFVASNLEEETG